MTGRQELAPLTVREATMLSRADLLDRLKTTRLMGFEQPLVYADAELSLETFDPEDLVPAQRYVLTAGVERALALREALAPLGIDPFALDGAALIETSEHPNEQVPLLPPIVEMSREPDGRVVPLINDGIHRVFAARSVGSSITVVLARGVPPEYPYYALALEGGWADVQQLDELPDGFQKKSYRNPDGYKALFRDFNAVFPGVQKERKQTNPEHLRA